MHHPTFNPRPHLPPPHNLLTSQIREARPQLQRRRLRLVHAGRLLTDGTQLTSWLGMLEERQQRAASKDKGKDEPDTSMLPSAPLSVPWLNCSVGPQLAEGEEEGEEQPQVRRLPFPNPFSQYTCPLTLPNSV